MQANLYAHIDTDFRGKFTLKMNVNLMKSTQVELYENNLFLLLLIIIIFNLYTFIEFPIKCCFVFVN